MTNQKCYIRNPYTRSMNSDIPMNTSNLRNPKLIAEEYYDYFDLGDSAPDFTLPGIVDDKPVDVSLSDYERKWVVLFFYGSDFTFV